MMGRHMTSELTRDRPQKQRTGYGVAAVLIIGSLVVFGTFAWVLPALFGNSPYSDHPVVIPGAVEHPPALWFFNYVIPAAAIIVFTALTCSRCDASRSGGTGSLSSAA